MYDDPRPSLAPLLRTGAALLCLFLGVIGLVLPLIPGIPFLIVGVLLLRRGRRATRSAPAHDPCRWRDTVSADSSNSSCSSG